MGLERYIGPNETIRLSFRIAFQFVLFQILSVIVVFGVIIYFFQDTFFDRVFATLAVCIIAFQLLVYYSTRYFATETSIYKKTGILWRKVVTARKKEVTDIQVQQSFAERFIFRTGMIGFNTSGSPTVEIHLPRVGSPWLCKKKILALWGI